MADSVTMTSKLVGTIGVSTIAGSATSTKTLYTSGGSTGVDLVQQTLSSTCTTGTFHPIGTEFDMGDVWKTDGHAVQLKNTYATSAVTTHCVAIFISTGLTVASGSLVVGNYYLATGGTLINNGVTWQSGEIMTAAHVDHTGTGTATLLVMVAKMWPGDFFGPIRRGAFTAAGEGALYHCLWGSASELTCPIELCAVEVGEPTA